MKNTCWGKPKRAGYRFFQGQQTRTCNEFNASRQVWTIWCALLGIRWLIKPEGEERFNWNSRLFFLLLVNICFVSDAGRRDLGKCGLLY
ncbi:hypothetical protein TNIN_361291 [Trichonephila inaurata madagascariensis]|uniref:Uncharacterized protein n=1 Tax=Trichonephila inaurata madagascariensis TaxID=2747483 RepID=A0A8X6YM63_9ARAC|nr:hypothetical protein TNIN_361291 [Trichonephila inaurata madagascariensis]